MWSQLNINTCLWRSYVPLVPHLIFKITFWPVKIWVYTESSYIIFVSVIILITKTLGLRSFFVRTGYQFSYPNKTKSKITVLHVFDIAESPQFSSSNKTTVLMPAVQLLASRGLETLHPTVQSDPGAHPGYYILMDSGAHSPTVRTSGHEADHSPLYSAEVKIHGFLPPLPVSSR